MQSFLEICKENFTQTKKGVNQKVDMGPGNKGSNIDKRLKEYPEWKW